MIKAELTDELAEIFRTPGNQWNRQQVNMAWEWVRQTQWPALQSIAYKVLHNADDAEDIVMDILDDFDQLRRKYKPEATQTGTIAAYIRTAVFYEARRQSKLRQRNVSLTWDDDKQQEREIPDEHPDRRDPMEQVIEKDDAESVFLAFSTCREHLQTRSSRRAEVFDRKVFRDEDYPTIAANLQITQELARQEFSRANAEYRKCLTAQGFKP